MPFWSQHSLWHTELEILIMGGQQGPPCQQRQPVNRRKRRIGRKSIGLQRQPWGSVLDPVSRVFKLENVTVLNTCEMFGITRMARMDAVNENGAAIWQPKRMAPLSQPSSKFLRSCDDGLCAKRALRLRGLRTNHHDA
jgi:hypothetical protein